MDNFDLRSYLSSNPLTAETPVLEGIDFLNRVGIKIQINEAEEDPKTIDILNLASVFDKEFDEETKDAISALVKTKPNKQDFKSLLDPTLKEEEKDEKKNTAFMNVVRNLQRIGKTNLLPLVMAFTIMGNALPKGIPDNPWDGAQEKIEQTYSPGEIDLDYKTLDNDDKLAFRGNVQVGGETVLDMNGFEDSMGDNIGGFGTGEGTTNPEVQAQVDDYWDNLTKSTVGQEGEADVLITGKYSKDSGANSNKSKTSDLDLDDERGQTVLKLLQQKLADSGGKINGVKVNLKVLDNDASDIEAQKDGDIGKGVILKTVFDTVKSTGEIPVDTVQDVYAFLNPLFARWKDVRWVKDSVDQVVQQYSNKKVTKADSKTSSDSSSETGQNATVEPPKPSTKKVTSSQTAKDIKAVQAGNLNRNGQIATVLRTLNFDNLNVFKELGKDAAISLSDGDLKKIIDNPESSEQAKTVARGIIQIRKNPDALLKRVSSVLGVKLDPRAKAVQLKPGQKGQAQFRAGVKENILNEGFVDDFITDEDIINNKVALLALLGSMYASDEVKGEYLSIANPDKLGFTDSERAEFEKLGWSRKDDSGDYVFLDKTATKKNEKPVPDADKAAQTISKIGGAEQKMDFINLKDELVDTIVKTWMKFSPTYRETPANISKVFTVLRNDPFGLKEEEEKEFKDVTNVFKVLQTNKTLDAQLSRINTNDEAIRIIRTGILPYINDVLKKNESQVRQAMKDALEILTNQLKQTTNERKLTKSELNKREDIIMKMKKNKRALTQKYGKDAEAVMYGRATKLAKKQAESMDQDRIREAVKAALQNPKKADLNKDGKLSDYEKKRGAAIEKSMEKQDLKEFGSSDMSALLNSMHRELGNPTEFPGLSKIMDAAESATDFYMDDFEEYSTDRDELVMSNARMYARRFHPDFMAAAAKFVEPLEEMDINDPIAMRLRADKDKLAKMRAANAGDDGNDKFFDAAKLRVLKAKRAEIMRDMEQEAEMEGGPIADKYGDMLNAVDAEIAKEKAMFGLEEGTELYNKDGFYFKRFYGGKEDGASLQITTDKGEYITIPGRKLGLFMSGLEKAVGEFDDMTRQLPIDEDFDLGHQDNEPHMLKADLYRIGKYAMELYQMVDQFEEGSEEVDFPHWWQSKIIKSKDALVGAKHYLDFELKEPQIDAMVDVASEEEVIDEPLNEGVWSLGSASDIKGAIHTLEMWLDLDAREISAQFDDKDNETFFYNVLGDDLFHDALDRAEKSAAMDDTDRAHKATLDAKDRAEELLAVVRERESARPYKTDIFEEDPGEADMVASDIQKAMNKHKGDDAKMYQLQKARTAMNKGDLDKAKKIAARLAEKLKSE